MVALVLVVPATYDGERDGVPVLGFWLLQAFGEFSKGWEISLPFS